MQGKKLFVCFGCLIAFLTAIFLFIKLKNHGLESDFKNQKDPIFLESFYNNKNDYFSSFASASGIPQTDILAGITNHHFLAKDFIAKFFVGIDPKRIKKVIVVGPDHFQKITAKNVLAESADTSWNTPFGLLSSDETDIYSLYSGKQIMINTNLFRNEHSIYTLIPFVKYVFPNVTVIPMVLRQSSDYDSFYNLGRNLANLTGHKDTILIVSSDFSHNSTPGAAVKNDQKSKISLSQKDIKDISSITCDCRQCIALLYGFLNDQKSSFREIYSSNSYEISGVPQNVTSYVGGYYVGGSN